MPTYSDAIGPPFGWWLTTRVFRTRIASGSGGPLLHGITDQPGLPLLRRKPTSHRVCADHSQWHSLRPPNQAEEKGEGMVRHTASQPRSHKLWLLVGVVLLAALLSTIGSGQAESASSRSGVRGPKFTEAAAFDVSRPLRELAKTAPSSKGKGGEVRPDRGPAVADRGHSKDGAIQREAAPAAIPAPLANFEGMSNQDNFDVFGFRVNPPDPVGDVGPNHYVEMVNLVFAVYDKAGNKLLGPVDTGTLWADFAVPDCTDPSGDPIILYDQFVDRW